MQPRKLINLGSQTKSTHALQSWLDFFTSAIFSFLWNELSSHLETQTKQRSRACTNAGTWKTGWKLAANHRPQVWANNRLDLENNLWSSRIVVRFLQSADLKWNLLICSSKTVPKKLGATMTFTLCSLSYTSSNAVCDYFFGTQETSLTLHISSHAIAFNRNVHHT